MNTRAMLLAVVLIGCDSGDNDITFTMTNPLSAGEERHLCQFVQLPESASGEVLVTGQKHEQNAAHHWSLIRTTVSSMPEGFALNEPVDCFTSGISAYAGSALFID